jgi:hypothetical protein
MKRLPALLLLSLGPWLATAAADPRPVKVKGPWCALHLLNFQNDTDLQRIEAELPALAARGVNVLVLEVDYGFEFRSHPELRSSDRPITRRGAKRLVKAAKRHGIRIIPEFQSFGHQSWAKETFTLLTRYPELDSTPGAFPQNEGIYCREWDPMNPRVYQIVYALLDEIIDARRRWSSSRASCRDTGTWGSCTNKRGCTRRPGPSSSGRSPFPAAPR